MTIDFEVYVKENYPALRRLGFLLCAEWATADDLVQTALIRCERRWHLVDDPHRYVRRAVVNAASTWRLRRRLEAPLSVMIEVPGEQVDSADRWAPELDPWSALQRRRARHSCRHRLQVTAGALLAFALVGQVILTSPASAQMLPEASKATLTSSSVASSTSVPPRPA